MRPLLARTVFLGFLLITVGIVRNALYLQGQHNSGVDELPMGYADNPALLIPPSRKASSPPKHADDPYAEVAELPAAADEVHAVQRELRARGYEPGPADGVAGILTQAAVMAYEHDNGWKVLGVPSNEILKRLLLGPSGAHTNSEASVRISPEARKIVTLVQKNLAELGYAPGRIDGVLGDATRRAIRGFENDRGVPEKGRISGKLIKELMKVTDMTLANAR